ncbi:MAG TPA: CDP-alcohol phosphatidyltransferase family protein [Bryobacteraceae bacterium]|jgi:CDP-diacylglycerol--glycerol-3-phosphate 3-phosphatidyltransferase|nr:CDP-alcohol phosphatidyltransferase family protein [Bryobacteraceae bacterium]
MLTRTIGRFLIWPIERVAAVVAATGIPPNFITWSALLLNLWAGIFFAAGRFMTAGGIMILACLCDLLDGPVARRQGRVSMFGGFLDSIFDRYADLILFLGLLVYYSHVNRFGYAMLAGAAMAGSVMVSYAKARAESLVPTAEVGFWERPERLALMILGALTNRMDVVLWILAIGPNITVIHRILHTWKQTERGNQPIPDAPPAGDGRRDGNVTEVRAGAPASLQAKIARDASPAVLTRTARRGG